MEVEDKRTVVEEDNISTLKPGTVAQLVGAIGLRSSMKLEHQIMIILDRKTILPEEEMGRFKNQTPVATLAGEFSWLSNNVHVEILDAKLVINSYDGKEGISVDDTTTGGG